MSSEWQEVCVGEISTLVTKGTTPTTLGYAFQEGGVNFVKVETLSEDGRFLKEKFAFISEEAHQALSRSHLKESDILFTIAGTIGRTGIVSAAHLPANTNQAVAIVRPNKELVEPRFLRYVFGNPAFVRVAQSKTVQSVQANFSLSELRQARLKLPSLDMQRAVVSVLGLLDDRITLLRETNATLEAIAQALFKSWFVDFDPVRAKAEGRQPEGMDATTAALFPDSFEQSELGLAPKGWRVGVLSDLASFQNGYAFKSQDWTDDGHPVVKIGDVKPGFIDFTGCSRVAPETVVGLQRFRLCRGDLLVGMTGYVGETGLVSQMEPAAYINQRVGRLSTPNGLDDLGMVYCVVRNPGYKAFAESQSHGSAQANVSGVALLSYQLVIPSAEIYDCLNRIMKVVLESLLANHEQAKTLIQLRDTLLPRLISGELRLPEAESLLENTL